MHHELASLRSFVLDATENRSANLERALTSSRQTGAAIGILMALHKLDQRSGVRLLRQATVARTRCSPSTRSR